jgi:hypothetical protein
MWANAESRAVRRRSVVGRLPRPDPGVIRALAAAIVGWSNGSFADEGLELIAHRLGGPGRFRSDSAATVEAVATFLSAWVSGVTMPRQISLIASRRIAFQLADSGPIRRGPPGLCRYAALVYSDRPGRAGSYWPSVHGEADYHPDDEKSDHDDSGDYPLHLGQPSLNRARIAAGLPGLRFHDLRHTGQTLAAATGATIKDLKPSKI